MLHPSRMVPLLTLSLVLTALLIAAPPAAYGQSTTSWTAEYFNNVTVTGPAALVRDDADINFDWGMAAPGAGVQADGFSARWTRWYYFGETGNYTFTMTSDDGSRLWVDDNSVLDVWWDHGPLARAVTLSLMQGYHLVRMEYYDRAGSAAAQLRIEPAGSFPDWKGEYFDNPYLSGTPTVIVNNTAINFNWGTAAPDPTLPADRFSVRWTRSIYLNAGTYRFTATADDGIRVAVGGTLLIDEWHDQPATTYTRGITLSAGTYPLRVEYFDDAGGALAIVSWTAVSGGSGSPVWNGQYFDNPNLTGDPAFTRADADLNFNWGNGSPANSLPADNFSARWDSARFAPAPGFYTVYATADDGLRVAVDGNRIIDQWHDASQTTYAATVYLTSGNHNWQVEYYEHLGAAALSVQITAGVTPPLPPPPAPQPEAFGFTVEDGGAGWLSGGLSNSWRTGGGSGGHSFWTYNNTYTQPGYNWGRWYPTLSGAGYYEVSAFIPAGLATTRSARYWIMHAGAYSLRTVAQAYYADQWVSLGTYYFSGAGGEYVSLTDITYECYLCYTIVWDAIKFSPR